MPTSWVDEKNCPQMTIDCFRFIGKYDYLIEKQAREIELFKQDEDVKIPPNMDYPSISLSTEVLERIKKTQPTSVGMLKRMEGITPSAIILILSEIRRMQRQSTPHCI